MYIVLNWLLELRDQIYRTGFHVWGPFWMYTVPSGLMTLEAEVAPPRPGPGAVESES